MTRSTGRGKSPPWIDSRAPVISFAAARGHFDAPHFLL